MTTALPVAEQRMIMTEVELSLFKEFGGPKQAPLLGCVRWIRERLSEFVWSKQAEICDSIELHRHTAVPSCHGPGKSFIAARIAAWWLSEHAPGEAFVVSTATTGKQVKAILWKEIGRAHSRGRLYGRLNQIEWWMDINGREEIVGFGIKPNDYDPDAFQGIHARYVLVIIDEAAGVSSSLFTAAEGLITNDDSRILAIGNPDDPFSHFAKICKPGSGWNVIHIGAQDTPNFTGEEIPDDLRALLVSRLWVEERKKEWGEGNPLYIARVNGQFPEDTTDGVIPLSWLRRCQPEEPPDYDDDDLLPIELGADIGAGGDWTVVRERRGQKAGRTWRKHTPEASQAEGLIMQAIRETDAERCKIDVIGIGWGVAGRLKELRDEGAHNCEIVKVNVGAASRYPARFPKLRDELWWMGRELSQDGAWDLSEVDDDCVAQLIAPTYDPDSSGRTKVEAKSDTIKRIGHSTDDADALLLAYYAGGKRKIRIVS